MEIRVPRYQRVQDKKVSLVGVDLRATRIGSPGRRTLPMDIRQKGIFLSVPDSKTILTLGLQFFYELHNVAL